MGEWARVGQGGTSMGRQNGGIGPAPCRLINRLTPFIRGPYDLQAKPGEKEKAGVTGLDRGLEALNRGPRYLCLELSLFRKG
jgi:hypothetical protein